MVKARLGIAVASVLVALSFSSVTIDGALAQGGGSINTGATSVPDAPASTPIRQSLPPQVLNASAEKVRKNYWLAYQLAGYRDLDKVAEADPSILAAICSHPGPARVLAHHPHLDKLAEADHYLCRRLCRWRRATDALVRNTYADIVIGLDPAGFVMAMDRDPAYAKIISGHVQFYNLIDNDPNLAKQIAEHIR